MMLDKIQPTGDSQWDDIVKAVLAILKKKHLRLTRDEWHDLKMDCIVATHDKAVANIARWDRRYPYYNYAYYCAWGVCSYIVDVHLQQIKWRLNAVCIDAPIAADDKRTVAETLDAGEHRLNYKRPGDAPRRLQTIIKHDYDDYCECCVECGTEPMTLADYTALNYSEGEAIAPPCSPP